MRQFIHTTFIFLLLQSIAALGAEQTQPALAEALTSEIKQLGADDFDAREKAQQAILELARDREGEVLALLKAEVKKSAAPELLARLEKLQRLLEVAGKQDWSVVAGQIYQLPSVSGGRVFVGNKDRTLYCLDALSGKENWKFNVDGFMYKSLAVADGRVFLIRTRKDGRPDGTLIALDSHDGRELWRWQDGVKSQYFTAPIVTGGALYFARENNLVRLNAMSGELDWMFDAEDSILSPPSVSGGKVLLGTLENGLLCVDAANGKPVWHAALGGACYSGGVVLNERVYAGGGNTLFCLDLKDGAIKWAYRGNEALTSAPAVKDKQVFAAFGMVFRCIDVSNGRALWDKDTGGHIFAAPSIVGQRVYVGALNDKLTLYCFDAQSGDELWTHETKEGGYAEPVLAGRRIFIGYHSRFYTLKSSMPGPLEWPMTGGNAARTGCNDR